MSRVADVIQRQIGLDAWLAVSARQAVAGETFLEFTFGPQGTNTRMRITLTPADLYDVEVARVHRRTRVRTVVWHRERVFNDALADIVRLANREVHG